MDTADLNHRSDIRRHVGYVSQLPERQLFAETVFDDVAFGPRNMNMPEDEVRSRVCEALVSVNLTPTDELLARSPFSLSGGQQRSVALAGVLAMRQDVLVLDEPMAGLDPDGRRHVRDLLRALKRAGSTLIMVTHSMEDVAELADHVIRPRTRTRPPVGLSHGGPPHPVRARGGEPPWRFALASASITRPIPPFTTWIRASSSWVPSPLW